MAFQNPIVAGDTLVVPAISSTDYVDGVSGWTIKADGSSQLDSVQVLHDLGADTITTNSLLIDGTSWQDTLDSLPRGVVARGIKGTDVDTAAIGTTETICYTAQCGKVYPGRLYRIDIRCMVKALVATTGAFLRIRYSFGTVNPPAVTSSALSSWEFEVDTVQREAFHGYTFFTVNQPVSNYRIALTLQSTSATNTVNITQSVATRNTEYMLSDVGPVPSNTAFAQVSKTSGSPDPELLTRYTSDYVGNWALTYAENGTQLGGGLFQGKNFKWGQEKSLLGFDYATIQSDLAGATIISVRLIARCKTALASNGWTAIIGSHNQGPQTSTYPDALVTRDRTRLSGIQAGSTQSIILPNAFGDEFKSGSTKGIAIGPADLTDALYIGSFYGVNGDANDPILRIVYDK